MKSLVKIALLSGVMALSLTACSTERKCYCLETSDSTTFVDGKCFQVDGTRDIVETIFITNPNGADVEFNTIINESHITFTDGLKGKRVQNAMRLNTYSIKVSIFGNSNFKALSERAREAYLYAYVAIGDSTGLADKPADIAK